MTQNQNHNPQTNPPNPKFSDPSNPENPDRQLIRKNAHTGLAVFVAILFMIGLSFASVPLYKLFCKVTGFNGTTQTAATLPATILDRTITVKFDAATGRSMPWDFSPEMRQIAVRLGEKGLTAFHAKNRADKPVTGTAVYNVTPLKAGKYFHKIECFCFGEQTLAPGQDVSMPVMFFIDPALNDDPDMQDIRTITLSYTFYQAESNELEDALEAFYNDDGSAIQATNKLQN